LSDLTGEASADVAVFKQFLSTIWFGRWSEFVPGVVASSGWEHTNVFERLENNVIVGYHSWIYLYNEQEDGDFNYLGYIDTLDTGKTTVVSMPVDLYGSTKAVTQFNFGASPELELALGTLCFVARPDLACVVSGSNGAAYNWDTHTVTYNGVQYVESSHPVFEPHL
jgi:poly(U)-specific endoribonuclease